MSKGKSTLSSLSYGSFMGVDELPEQVLSLFLPMLDQPQKEVEFTDEIITAGLNGKINFSKIFNIDAYEYAIRNNSHMNTEKERSKKTFIDFSCNDSEKEVSLRNGGVAEDRLTTSAIQELTDAFEEVVDNEEVAYAISTIKSLNDDFIVDYGIDLVALIKKAVIGFPQAIERLKNVCSDFEVVSEQVHVILASGKDVNTCFES